MVHGHVDDSSTPVTRENFAEIRDRVPFLARKIFDLLLRVQKGSLTVSLPEGEVLRFESDVEGPVADIQLNNWHLMRKLAFGGTIGAGESYMDGDWKVPTSRIHLSSFW